MANLSKTFGLFGLLNLTTSKHPQSVTGKYPFCHSEHSEESPISSSQTLRFAQSLSRPCRGSDSFEIVSKLTTLLLVSLAICFWALPAQAQYGGGSGTAGNPYLINTAEQMNAIGANPGDWNKHFMLIADVNMGDIAGTNYNVIETFTGTFDGNDCTISNFSLTSTRQENTGLFGTVGAGGEIKNLRLLNPDIFAQGRNVGSLIGFLNHGSITNCRAKGAAVSGDSYVGGLVGTNTGNIIKCGSTGSVWADQYAGGLAGQVGEGKVTLSYSTASVYGNRNVGGLVGKTGSERSEVTHCYASGTVTGSTYVGGLVGQVERGNTYKSYSTGSVSGSQYTGGLVGYTRVLGRVAQSFWDTQTSGQTTSAGGTGKTTAEMKMVSTFSSAAWDFWNTWTICEQMNYPVLQWQISAADFLCPDGVNFIDFNFFAEHLNQRHCNQSNNYCDGTDLDHSGLVDLLDLAIFVDEWLEGVQN